MSVCGYPPCWCSPNFGKWITIVSSELEYLKESSYNFTLEVMHACILHLWLTNEKFASIYVDATFLWSRQVQIHACITSRMKLALLSFRCSIESRVNHRREISGGQDITISYIFWSTFLLLALFIYFYYL
jgi:hypothetical protein